MKKTTRGDIDASSLELEITKYLSRLIYLGPYTIGIAYDPDPTIPGAYLFSFLYGYVDGNFLEIHIPFESAFASG